MESRIKKIKQKIQNDQIDALFITSPHNISYLTNLLPLSNEEREYYILVTGNNAYILAPKMFMLAIKEKIDGFTYIEITKDKSLYKLIEEICIQENVKQIGFEEENLLYREFAHLSEKLKGIEFIPLESFIEDEREIKDETEIAKIKEACRITDEAYSNILKNVRMNISEIELSWEIESYIRKKGAELAFPTIVAFGKNAATPHHISDDTKLNSNSFVLFDFGAKFEGYCSDMSRTVYFGTPSENDRKIYQTVLDAQQMALEKLKEWTSEGFEVAHLHEIAESHIEHEDFPAFPHSLGHGVGLQVHEAPSISKFSEGNELKTNSVITIEPATYIPEIGGVRIEDDVLLTQNGYEVLTKSPKELTVIK